MIIYNAQNNHIPDEIWALSRTQEVYIRDEVNGDIIRVLDCTEYATAPCIDNPVGGAGTAAD